MYIFFAKSIATFRNCAFNLAKILEDARSSDALNLHSYQY